MEKTTYILAHDIGTTGNKSCIYKIGKKIELTASSLVEYPLFMVDDGGAEQKADDWWKAICSATKEIMKKSRLKPDQIKGIAFCTQMQGTIMVDKNGKALRNPMNYMDSRSTKQIEKYLYKGLIKINKWNAFKALKSLIITGGLAATAKDPLWKYHWIKDNEPHIFNETYKWLDVKDYLTLRCTGKYGMTRDSANLTFIYDTRPGKLEWHRGLCRMFDVNMDHLPPVVSSTDVVGELTSGAARDMGLKEGIPVFGGGGDASLIPLGAGCLELYETHIYVGTSGWVVSNVNKRMADLTNFIASIIGAIPGQYNYIAEQETSGACLQWVRDHLALDEIGIYLKAKHVAEQDKQCASLFDFLNTSVDETPPGAGNVLFTPWLHGNRAPREDPYCRGMFFNIDINTGKRQLIRAVLEGVAYNKRWLLEAVEKKVPRQDRIRFVGGGARSETWCQIMADVTGRRIETVENPQNAGTIGAALVCAVGLGIFDSFESAKSCIPASKVYEPDKKNKALYDRNFEVFKKLYDRNRKLFKALNK